MVCGIYLIRNKVNNKIYIGSSLNIKERWQRHLLDLNKCSHSNIYLQRSWNKYKDYNFEFKILIECDLDMLLFYEQQFLDKWKPEYNIAINALAPNRGRKLSKKHRNKISKSLIGNKRTLGRIRPENERKKIRDFHKGKCPSDLCLQKAFKARIKLWHGFISPRGNKYLNITNLAEFCRKHNLNYGNMHSIDKGIRLSHKGWIKCP